MYYRRKNKKCNDLYIHFIEGRDVKLFKYALRHIKVNNEKGQEKDIGEKFWEACEMIEREITEIKNIPYAE